MGRPKSNNVQVNISIPMKWKIGLENLARIYCIEEGEIIAFLDLMFKFNAKFMKNVATRSLNLT